MCWNCWYHSSVWTMYTTCKIWKTSMCTNIYWITYHVNNSSRILYFICSLPVFLCKYIWIFCMQFFLSIIFSSYKFFFMLLTILSTCLLYLLKSSLANFLSFLLLYSHHYQLHLLLIHIFLFHHFLVHLMVLLFQYLYSFCLFQALYSL